MMRGSGRCRREARLRFMAAGKLKELQGDQSITVTTSFHHVSQEATVSSSTNGDLFLRVFNL